MRLQWKNLSGLLDHIVKGDERKEDDDDERRDRRGVEEGGEREEEGEEQEGWQNTRGEGGERGGGEGETRRERLRWDSLKTMINGSVIIFTMTQYLESDDKHRS